MPVVEIVIEGDTHRVETDEPLVAEQLAFRYKVSIDSIRKMLIQAKPANNEKQDIEKFIICCMPLRLRDRFLSKGVITVRELRNQIMDDETTVNARLLILKAFERTFGETVGNDLDT